MTKTVPVDAFSRSIEELVGDIDRNIAKQMPQVLSQSLQLGKRHVVANISQSGIQDHSGRYRAGWAARRDKTAENEWQGHVYNKDVPGLPHLLEKGHAKVGGGRVQGHEHIAPAAEDVFEDFERRVGKAVDKAL